MEGQNKRQKKEAKNGIRIGSFLAILFFMLYIPSFIYWVSGRTIPTDVIRMATIEDAINADGYIVRNEEVLKAPFEGKCIFEVKEGERAAANSKVAMILGDTSEKLVDDLKALDLRILKAQKEQQENQGIFSEDVLKLDTEIGEKVRLIIDQSNSNTLVGMNQIKDDIDGLILRKASIAGSNSTADQFLESLKKQKEGLQQQINQSTKEIITQLPGIISYTVDGYEPTLTPDAIKQLTPKLLEGIKNKEVKKNINNMTVKVNAPFARVIKDIDARIVAALDPGKAQKLKEGDSIKVRINDINKMVTGSIDYKSSEIDGKVIVSVKIDQGVSETAGMRKINIDLVSESYSGLQVPFSSLKDVDLNAMTASIFLVKANYAEEKKVKIVGKNDDSAIITDISEVDKGSVNLYDMYVINPKNIQTGQLINQ